MKKQHFMGCAFALLLCLYSAFCGMSLNASASGNVTLPYSFFSNNLPTIDAYYVASDLSYKPITFTLYAEQTFFGSNLDTTTNFTNRTYYAYRATTPADMYVQGTAPYITADINLSFSNVTYMSTGILTWCGEYRDNRILSYNLSSLRSNFYTEYYFDGSRSIQYIQANTNDSSYPGFANVANDPAIYCGWGSTFQSEAGAEFNFGSSSISTFWNSNGIWLAILSPVINDDYVFEGVSELPSPDTGDDWGTGESVGTASGTIVTDTSGNQNVTVTIETDNTGLIGGLLNGIKRLFIPTADDLQGFSSDMEDIATEHLGGLYEAVDMLTDAFEGIDDIEERTSIHVNAVTIPLLGTDTIQLGNWDIPLKPSTEGGFAVLYTAIALITDFLAGFAFLRMCKNKLNIILNPESEVVAE